MDANSLVARDRCPACKAKGKDTSKDNLAIYADGHEHCYACGYYKPARDEERIRKLAPTTITEAESKKAPGSVQLPIDASELIPADIVQRLLRFGLTPKHLKKHNFKWSNSKQRLIMPVYDGYGQLLMYQERSWDISEKKYLTYGKPSDILHILMPEDDLLSKTVILVEDLISAIRVADYLPAMPLWGSDIPLKTIKRLASRFEVVGVWLDPDMKLKAVKDVLRISQYVPAFFIESGMDPKMYNLAQIKEHIDISGYHVMYQDKEVDTKPKKIKEYPVWCNQDYTKLCRGNMQTKCCQDT